MRFLFLIGLFLSVSIVNADWKDVLLPTPLHNLTAQCLNDTNTWFESLETIALVSIECVTTHKCSLLELKILEDNLYAIEELDAFGQIPVPGMFELTDLYDGSSQECQRVSGKKYDTNYCYLVLKPGKHAACDASNSTTATLSALPLRLAVCLPYSCNHQDMINIFNQMSPYPFTACSAYCSKYEVKKDSAFWGFTIFMIVMVSIAVFASFVDNIRDTVFKIKSNKEKNVLLKILLAFSFWTNAELILSVKEQKPGFIKSLDCIRLLSMCWVVTGHSFLYFSLSDTLSPLLSFRKQFWNHLISSAFLSVDTFFVLSGIVVAYLFFKTKPTKKLIINPITWVLFYVHRYLRLTPPVMIFIGFFTVYAPYIQGPFAASQLNQIVQQTNACQTTWWQNLLYINNIVDQQNTCYGITWYLAVDTQLYLVVPVILIGLYFSLAMGIGMIVAGCIGSIITVYILFDKYNISADFFGNGDSTHFNMVYTKPWIRFPQYFVGIFTGYLLATYGARKVRLNWALAIAGWVVAFVIAGFCLFSTYDYDKGSHWSKFTRGTFYNFHRLGWSVFISWVVSANHMGWGGPINNFMSHPIWQPFGRLSYCAYIVHWMVLYYFLNVGGHALHYYSAWEVFIYISLPATFFAYVFAFFWSCLFEIPTLKIEKMVIESLIGVGRTSAKLENGFEKKQETSGSWDEGKRTQEKDQV